jgi:hypothetical protein
MNVNITDKRKTVGFIAASLSIDELLLGFRHLALPAIPRAIPKQCRLTPVAAVHSRMTKDAERGIADFFPAGEGGDALGPRSPWGEPLFDLKRIKSLLSTGPSREERS